ncbi:unnamed protein product [Parnassius apollo]|uniref:(apollo) hypothetical protein n=1 Tax=Parnassius apollo TaxID=110799 RepID=A0A8S3YCS8_PARAO|nr:unnamed protein product [Parnassius apollo]
MENRSIYDIRKEIGRILVEESPPKNNVNMVVPIPDSGIPAAIGYAKHSGLPMELGIIRNHYIGRTFIQPTAEVRKVRIKLKFNANKHTLKASKKLYILLWKIFCLDTLVGEGPSARTLRIDLPPFTLIGATTRLGLLSAPLRDRFGIPLHLEFYSFEELVNIIKRGARVLSNEIEENSAREIACRARGTPRIALRLLRRIRDFVEVKDDKKITYEVTDSVLLKLGVDKMGLNKLDMHYLRFLFNTSGPVGIGTISIALSEDVGNIEETV